MAIDIKDIIIVINTVFCCGCVNDHEVTNNFIDAEVYRESIFTRFPEDNDTVDINELYVIHNPYNNSGEQRFKGAMHNHTENSVSIDGFKSAPTEWIVKKYRDDGKFDFISITDHNYVTPNPEVDGIIWMGSSVEDTDLSTDGHHLVVYNLPDGYQYRKISDNINEQIDYYHSIGAIVNYAHPNWDQQYQTDEKISKLIKVDFVEVFNAGEEQGIRVYNAMLLKGPIGAFATDDFHYNPETFEANTYFNKSYLIVYGHHKEQNSIWNDILHGRYYASCGAVMEISYNNTIITVSSDCASTIEFHGVSSDFMPKDVVIASEHNVTVSSYTIDGTQPVVWALVKNENGSAISQAFHIKKISE